MKHSSMAQEPTTDCDHGPDCRGLRLGCMISSILWLTVPPITIVLPHVAARLAIVF